MAAAAPALASSAISAGGGLIGSGLSFRSAKLAMKFQERMARNRYQYTMEDMRAAGLNPAMMYQRGGAQPFSASTSGHKATIGNPFAGVVSDARTAARLSAEKDLLRAQASQATNAAGKERNLALESAIRSGLTRAQTLNELNKLPETSAKAEWYHSGPGRAMMRGSLAARDLPPFYNPIRLGAYGVGAGFSSAKDLETLIKENQNASPEDLAKKVVTEIMRNMR